MPEGVVFVDEKYNLSHVSLYERMGFIFFFKSESSLIYGENYVG
jgi:hypothetical protein